MADQPLGTVRRYTMGPLFPDVFPDQVVEVQVAKPPAPVRLKSAPQSAPNTDGRDKGTDRVWNNTPENWRKMAMDTLWQLCRSQAEVTTDDLWENLAADPPGHHSVVGALWLEAIRVGMVEKTGRTVKTRRTVANARDVPVYKSLHFNGVKKA